MIEYNEIELGPEDYEAAFTETSFLFEVLVGTVNDVIGNSAPLGVSAGRSMAKKIPVNFKDPELEEVLAVVQKQLINGCDFSFEIQESAQQLKVQSCMIRDICLNQNKAIGGEMCAIFHYYLSGMIAQLLGKQARLSLCECGDACLLDLKTR